MAGYQASPRWSGRMEMNMELQQSSNKRVRINLSQTAKGLCQIDATTEFETVAECEKELDAAIKAARRVIAANGLKEVHE
jgi:hypothetical protein